MLPGGEGGGGSGGSVNVLCGLTKVGACIPIPAPMIIILFSTQVSSTPQENYIYTL